METQKPSEAFVHFKTKLLKKLDSDFGSFEIDYVFLTQLSIEEMKDINESLKFFTQNNSEYDIRQEYDPMPHRYTISWRKK